MSEDILDVSKTDSADDLSDIRFDATMTNLLTKMGTGSDRVEHTTPNGIGYWSQQTLEDLAEHLILNRVATAKVDAATQKGWELILGSDGDNNILEDFNDLHEELGVEEAFNEAQFQANVYGGAVIIIIADDKKSAYEPIDNKNLKKIVGLEVLDRYKVEPILAVTDVNPLYPEKYRLILPEYVRKSLITVTDNNPQYIVDKSRIIRFDADGIRSTPDMLRKNQGWGKSLLAALWEDYRDWKSSLKATGAMVQDASLFVQKIKDLSKMMKNKDADLLEARLKLNRLMISVFGGVALDSEGEDINFASRNFAGVPEVATQQRDSFIGVSGIPHDKLFGESPSGLGATGESEEKNWAAHVADFQSSRWKKKLRQLFKLIFLSKEGPTKGELIKGWSIKFHNLMVESEAEKISNMATMASTDQTYISAGVLLVEEVRQSRFGKSGFSIETTLDDKLFKKQQEEAKQQEQDPYGGFGGGFPEEQAPPEEVQQDSYDYRADAVDISTLEQKDGKVLYRGKWMTPNKPMSSDRAGKKRMVLAKESNQVALVHYGAEGYKHNYSPEAKKSFLARMQGVKTKDGKPAYKDKFSPAYWAIKDLWNPNEPADGRAKYDSFEDENTSSYSRPKRIINWNNIGIGITHEPGDIRFPMSEPMKCSYGHIRGSYGDAPDKKALDVYVGNNLNSANGYKVRQLDPKTGFYDEDKYFIGFKTPEDVRSNFIYHAGSHRFGGIELIKPDELSVYRQDNCSFSIPEIDTGTKVLSGDRQINVVNEKNITDAINSIYPEKITSLDKWNVAGNGNIIGEFSSEYGTYKFGIKKGLNQDVLTYKWNRESREDSRVNERKGYHWVSNKEVKGGGYWRKNPGKSLQSPEFTPNNSEKDKSKSNGAGIGLAIAGGVAALGIAGGVTALALASRGGGSGSSSSGGGNLDPEIQKTVDKKEQEAKAKAEQERVKREQEAEAKTEQERVKREQERVKREQEAEAKAEQERVKREQEVKAEQERVKREQEVKAEQERVKREQEVKAEQERVKREQEVKAEQERIKREQEAKAKAEQERVKREQEAKAKAEQERVKRKQENSGNSIRDEINAISPYPDDLRDQIISPEKREILKQFAEGNISSKQMIRQIQDMEDNSIDSSRQFAINQYSSYLDKLEDKYNKAGSTAARLSAIVHSRGWSKPKVVGESEFNELSKSSDYIKLYRGVSSPTHKESFLNGENFMGAGQFGEGLYFSPDRNKALDYVRGDENNLIEVLMPKTAKRGSGYEAGSFDDIIPGGEKLYTVRHKNAGNMSGGQSGKNEKLALLGYEYENRGGNPRDDEYIVYNPSMLITKRKNKDPNASVKAKAEQERVKREQEVKAEQERIKREQETKAKAEQERIKREQEAEAKAEKSISKEYNESLSNAKKIASKIENLETIKDVDDETFQKYNQHLSDAIFHLEKELEKENVSRNALKEEVESLKKTIDTPVRTKDRRRLLVDDAVAEKFNSLYKKMLPEGREGDEYRQKVKSNKAMTKIMSQIDEGRESGKPFSFEEVIHIDNNVKDTEQGQVVLSGVETGLKTIEKIHSTKELRTIQDESGLPYFFNINVKDKKSILGFNSSALGSITTGSKQNDDGIIFDTLTVNTAIAKELIRVHGKEKAKTMMELTLIHEIGHSMDLLVLGSQKRFATSIITKNGLNQDFSEEAEMSPLMSALRKSEGVKQIKNAMENSNNPQIKKYGDYLLQPVEIYARAYTQYIAHKSNRSDLKNELKNINNLDYGNSHWSDEEFNSLILPEFDKIFRNKGMLK